MAEIDAEMEFSRNDYDQRSDAFVELYRAGGVPYGVYKAGLNSFAGADFE